MAGLSHEREEELFFACLDLPVTERSTYLERECGADTRLRLRLERLLAAHGRAEVATLSPLHDFLDPAAAVLAGAAGPAEGGEGSQTGRVGDTVGPYRLLRLLAEGGMGSVWLAERGDGMVNRPIALKLPRGAFRLGQLAARMAREREILATLSHPNIARLYDAGVTSEGQPYLALEYVDGRRIDEYCREERLDPKARLGLFVQVAQAVAHAHAKLVVHRDLKPANVLVTGDGQVRLLDFGIARLLEDGRAQESEVTRAWGRAFTPDYASPEQVAGEPITIASDVYSLGVMLYELLTGTRPYQPARDSWGAFEDAVLNTEPTRPSDAAAPSLRSTLRGDLDTILLKALKKRPEERYATVNAFVEDIERYLDFRPVRAQPDTAWYRLAKFVGRNRLSVGAGGAVLLAVLVGAGGALWQARVARAEHKRAAEVKDFLTSILWDTSPYAETSRSSTVLDLLNQARAAIDQSPGARPELRVELLGIVGTSLMNHQDTATAEIVLKQAVDEALRALGPEHPETIRARVRLLSVHRFRGRTRVLRQELDALLPVLRLRVTALAEELVIALKNKTHLEMDDGRYPEALPAAEEAMAIAAQWLGPRHRETVAASLMFALASARGGPPDVALQRTERAYVLTREVFLDARHPRRIEAENLYGRALANAGQLARGVDHIAAAVQQASEVFGPSNRMVGVFSRQLARYQIDMGEIQRALETGETALRIAAEHSDPDSFRHADALLARGESLLAALRTPEAVPCLAAAVQALSATLGPSHQQTAAARVTLALALGYDGQTEKARRELSDVVESQAAVGAGRSTKALFAVGVVERLSGRYAEALGAQQERLASLGAGPAADLDRMRVLGEIGLDQVALGQPVEATASLEQALALSRALQTRTAPERADILAGLGSALLARRQPAEALPFLREADAFWREFAPGSRWAADSARGLRRGRAALGKRAGSRPDESQVQNVRR
jgi:eukaryotic-like serine/threonine-protein kinase